MAVKEILYRFTSDISDVRNAFRQMDSLWQSHRSKQQADRDAELRALDDYASRVKSLVEQMGAGTGGAKGTRAPGGSRGASRGPAAMAPEWQAATTKLRADIAQEASSTAQVTAERQRILGLIDAEINALRRKSELTVRERSELQKATLERERQSDAMRTGGKIGVTAGTREALRGVGGIATSVSSAAIGGIGGDIGGFASMLGAGLIGGLTGGGIVVAIQAATEAMSKFVGEVSQLVMESDKLQNIQNTFEALSTGMRADPSKMINDLRVATHGLVSDTELYTQANSVMLQGLGLTESQISDLFTAVNKLATGTGKDLAQSTEGVSKALAGGRLTNIAYALGLQDTTKELLNNANALHGNMRVAEQYSIIMKAINDVNAGLPENFENASTAVKRSETSWHNFLTRIAGDIGSSPSLQRLFGAPTNMPTAPPKGALTPIGAGLTTAPLAGPTVSISGTVPGGPLPGSLQGELPDFQHIKTMAEQRAKVEIEAATQVYDAEKSTFDLRLAAYKQFYESGNSTLSQFVDEQKGIREQETFAQITEIEKQSKARQTALNVDAQKAQDTFQRGGTQAALDQTMKEINAQRTADNAATITKILELWQKLALDEVNLDQQTAADKRAALQTQAQEQYDIVKAGYDKQAMILEQNFKHGLVEAQDYLDQRKLQIAEERDAAVVAENSKFEATQKSTTDIAAHQKTLTDINLNAQKQTLAITLETFDKADAAQQEVFSRQKALLQSHLSVAQATGSKAPGALGLPTGTELSLIQQLVDATEKEMVANEKELATLDQQDARYSEIQKRIDDNRLALIQYNQELAKSTEMLSTQGGFLQNIGKAFSVLSGPGGQRLSGGFSAVGGMLSTIGGFALAANQTAARGGGSAGITSFVPGFQGVPGISPGGGGASGGGSLWKDLTSSSLTLTQKFQELSKNIDAGIASVAGFAQVLQGRGGVAGGAISGAGLGQQLGGNIAGMAGLTGPAGAALGAGMAGIGAIVGIFSAKARAETEKLAQTITDQFNNVTQSLNIGTTSLNQAIQQTEALRAQAVSQLSGAKGGQDQLNQILPQFNQTIAQLQEQAAKIMETMDETTQLMSAPQPFQQYLQNIDQIITKYQQYIAAGGSVTEANQFLSESFSALLTTSTQQLLSNEAGAIQNAISVQDIQLQQQQLALNQQMAAIQEQILVFNTNAQIAQIMAQGNVTRQAPTAMTKGLQVAQVEMQFQLQQQQYQLQQKQMADQAANLAEQEQVAQYQLSVQQQIFGLAADRVALEMQLAAVQEGQFNLQENQVTALNSLVTMLQTGDFGNITSAILAGGSTAAALMAGLAAAMQSMGLSPSATGPSATTLQTILQLLAGIPGLNPPMTLPGPFGQPVQQPLPGFAEGGVVPGDMMAMVHKGEIITPVSDIAGQVAAATQRAATEGTILSTAQMRLQIETQIHQLRLAELNALRSGSTGANGLLDVYQARGRQGFSGFFGEIG